MNILQTPTFKKKYKKFTSKQQDLIKRYIGEISSKPNIGILKNGDLSNVRVYKFKIQVQQYLLAYILNNHTKTITLLAIGSHENFYRNLSKNI